MRDDALRRRAYWTLSFLTPAKLPCEAERARDEDRHDWLGDV